MLIDDAPSKRDLTAVNNADSTASISRSSSSSSSSSSLSSIFESSLHLLGSLPVAATPSARHEAIAFRSERFGDLELFLPDVDTETERELQSHLLWPASVRLAKRIERSDGITVEGHSVLELGAGAGLPSLMASLCGADVCTITDYPSPSILQAIKKNVDVNLTKHAYVHDCVRVSGLDWTHPDDQVKKLLEMTHGQGFTRILAADTLWLSSMHESQINVMTRLLAKTTASRVYIVAGLHSERRCVRSFLRAATEKGLQLYRVQEWNRLTETAGRVWSMETEDDEDERSEGTEEERRCWLVEAEMGWRALSDATLRHATCTVTYTVPAFGRKNEKVL